jgi:hypothetical protein
MSYTSRTQTAISERGTATLWRGLVGWPVILVATSGVVAYFGTMEWGDNMVVFAFLGAFIVIPIGLIGLAVTSDSTGERVVSGVVAAGMVLFDAAIVILIMALTQVS